MRVFVYGTLMPGGLRWPHLAPAATRTREASVAGRLYDTGNGWPAALFDAAATTRVPGVVVELDSASAEETLALLDEIEGVADELYRRVRVVTDAGEEAWAWPFAGTVDGMRPIERWDRAFGER